MKKIIFLLVILILPRLIYSQDSTMSQKIFQLAEVMPKFPGGEAEMFSFIGKNIYYPNEAKENGISGTVYLSFLIDTTGKVDSVKVLRGVQILNEEAVRVVKSMPNWTPGMQNGRKVIVQLILPVKFNVQNGKAKGSVVVPKVKSKRDEFFEMGNAYINSGYYENAIESFTNAINEDKKDMDSHFNRAVCFKKLELMNAACIDLHRAKKLGDKGAANILKENCGTIDATNKVQTIPEFAKDGYVGMVKFISVNLRYPQKANENKIEGTVYVKFVVDSLGNSNEFQIVKGIGSGCDEEAIRLISSMPTWIPAKKKGVPIKSEVELPVRFKL